MSKKDFILEVYKDPRTVFTFNDIAFLLDESDFSRLKQKVNYYVKNNSIKNIRRGIYVKDGYDVEELACKIYTPAYISFEYVLLKEGLAFQYTEQLTQASYLSRTIEVGRLKLNYRKLKGSILVNTTGVLRKENGVNIATPERALLDTLYLNKDYYFDNLSVVSKAEIKKILPIYHSVQLSKRVDKLIKSSQTLKP